MTVSVVIPTRNRHQSLRRLLQALSKQSMKPAEIIVVDASDGDEGQFLQAEFPGLPLQALRTTPSVCRQRNVGIARSSSEFVFLCDDDMEPEPAYISTLLEFLSGEPDISIATGWILEPGSDGWGGRMPSISCRRLLWNASFGLSVWADVEAMRVTPLVRPLFWLLRRHYKRMGNTRTTSGWPLVTQVGGTSFRTAVFGLGASIMRRSVFTQTRFHEGLDERGIGDNYLFARSLSEERPIAVVTSTSCRHYRLSGVGPPDPERFARRVLVLDYALSLEGRTAMTDRIVRAWSIAGALFPFILHRAWPLVRTSARLFRIVLCGQNPYLRLAGTTGAAPSPETFLPEAVLDQYTDETRNALYG